MPLAPRCTASRRLFLSCEVKVRSPWSRHRRFVSKAEWSDGEANPRFIAKFRRRFSRTSKGLLVQVLLPAREMEWLARANPGSGVRNHQIGDGLQPISAARARQGSRRIEFVVMASYPQANVCAQHRLKPAAEARQPNWQDAASVFRDATRHEKV
jgi:hypothetical protein